MVSSSVYRSASKLATFMLFVAPSFICWGSDTASAAVAVVRVVLVFCRAAVAGGLYQWFSAVPLAN